jgi:hypothetical protein
VSLKQIFLFWKISRSAAISRKKKSISKYVKQKKKPITLFDQKKSLEHATSFITKQKIKDKIEAQPYEHRHTALLQ